MAKIKCACCGRLIEEEDTYESLVTGELICFDCYDEEEDLRAIEEEWINDEGG